MKPKILLSANKNKEYYIDAVNGCGGIADAKYLPDVNTNYDGLILCGGNDINPERYGEKINGAVNIDYERDEVEFALAKAFVEAQKPVMGICRGSQLLNILFEGTLLQEISDVHKHSNFTDYYCVHNVTAKTGSIFAKLYGNNFAVNSSHHQAVKQLGKKLVSTLNSGDIIEGFEHKHLPVFGVQWHPERMCFSQKRADAIDGQKLFEYFLSLC